MADFGGIRRVLGSARAGVGVTGFAVLVGVWLLLPARWRGRRWLAKRAWRALLWGFDLRVVVRGTPLAAPGTLFVANHVSWTDIPVLALVLEAGFVAKGDMRGWPILGKLTAAYGCLFVERERRGQAGDQAAAVARHLEAERGLVLFPEGTTGLGDTVLPFRSSLFALVPGVTEGTARVQPVTLRYGRRDRTPLSPEAQRQVAWIGDDALLPHAAGLTRLRGLSVEVWFEAPVAATDRKGMARACEAAVVARLAGR